MPVTARTRGEPPLTSSSLTYAELVGELFPRLTAGIRWGLERTRRMLAAVGDPHRCYRTLHVGGTNGKGSVAAHLEAVLRQQGRRVGLYSSPHLCTFRERIRIHGSAIDEAALLRAAARLWPVIGQEAPSFFEATTAIALLALAEAGVDDAVIEVGLGGRLDATNVIEPDVAILTNVSLDHVQLLGPTVAAVALEKAGIIKPGVPVVTGEAGATALGIFRDAAAAARAPLHVLEVADIGDVETTLTGTAFTLHDSAWGELRLCTPLLGVHQATNAALAVAALQALSAARPTRAAVVSGIAQVRWPGRLQLARVAQVSWLFDVAHNVAGVDALVAAIRTLPIARPVAALIGVLGDKDWRNMLAPLHAATDHVILTIPPTAPADRRWNPVQALAAAPSERAVIVTEFGRALEHAHQWARSTGGTVLVTGSFHTVGDALAALGLCADGSDITLPAPTFLQ